MNKNKLLEMASYIKQAVGCRPNLAADRIG